MGVKNAGGEGGPKARLNKAEEMTQNKTEGTCPSLRLHTPKSSNKAHRLPGSGEEGGEVGRTVVWFVE